MGCVKSEHPWRKRHAVVRSTACSLAPHAPAVCRVVDRRFWRAGVLAGPAAGAPRAGRRVRRRSSHGGGARAHSTIHRPPGLRRADGRNLSGWLGPERVSAWPPFSSASSRRSRWFSGWRDATLSYFAGRATAPATGNPNPRRPALAVTSTSPKFEFRRFQRWRPGRPATAMEGRLRGKQRCFHCWRRGAAVSAGAAGHFQQLLQLLLRDTALRAEVGSILLPDPATEARPHVRKRGARACAGATASRGRRTQRCPS